MNVYITKINGMYYKSAEQYAQHMTTDIAHTLGIREMGIYRYNTAGEDAGSRSRRFDGIIAGIGAGDIVICQFPTWNGLEFEKALVRHIKAYRGRIVIFIHDLEAMMSESNRSMLQDTVRMYNEAEVLIVPSQRMKHFLMEHGIITSMKFIVQELWDYTTLRTIEPGKLKREMHYAGNQEGILLSNKWNYEIPLNFYADEECQGTTVKKRGWIPPEELLQELSRGGFGLVWYGDEYQQEYLSMANSLKLSAYLAAGIPVIVPEGISNQSLIEENHLGIAVETLDEAVEIVKNITEQEYAAYTSAVAEFAPLVREGFFTKKCLVDALQMCRRKDMYTYAESNEICVIQNGRFEYVCLNESYQNHLALSWSLQGEAEGFLICDADSGKLVQEVFNGLEHYLLLENCPKESHFVVKAYIRTLNGKMVVAESDVAALSRQYQRPAVVSLIMPAYNAQEYIARSIDTALAQSFAELELLIINDGSTDGTQSIIDWYQERYPQIRAFYKSNGGQASARNVGVEQAKGEYIALMDNDDMIRPNMIERLYGSAVKNDCDIAVTSVYMLTKERYAEMTAYPMVEDVAVSVEEFWECYMRELSPVIWNKLYRACLVKEHPFAVNVTYEDDAWTPYVLSYAKRVCFINAHLYEYDRRIRDNTAIHASWSKPIEEKFLDHKELVMFFLNNGSPERKVLLKRLAIKYMSAFMGAHSYPKYEELKKEIEEM